MARSRSDLLFSISVMFSQPWMREMVPSVLTYVIGNVSGAVSLGREGAKGMTHDDGTEMV